MPHARTDTHRRSAIRAADYEYLGCTYQPPSGDPFAARRVAQINRATLDRIQAHRDAGTGQTVYDLSAGACTACGSVNALSFAHYRHRTTGDIIRLGLDCAAKFDMDGHLQREQFRREIRSAMDFAAGRQKAAAMLQEAGLGELWDWYADDTPTPDVVALMLDLGVAGVEPWPGDDADPETQEAWRSQVNKISRATGIGRAAENAIRDERTIGSIISTVIRTGRLSDSQVRYLGTLRDRSLGKPAELAREAYARHLSQQANAEPCPEGRRVIAGTVISVAERDTPYGLAWKMLVDSGEGWRCWGTVPASLDPSAIRGKRVRFTATLKPSSELDFGFFSRPTKAEVIG